VAAAPANLVVSKIHYHPAPPTAAEITAGFSDDKDFEYLELMNYGAQPVSLQGLRFVDGIDFTFTPGVVAELAPGGRGVIVNNLAAFTARYGTGIRILGQFTSGNLSNDGETLALLAANGSDLWRFTYNDGGAWPDSPDGGGPALALINPDSPPDNAGMSLPQNWRPSVSAGGSPGANDRISLASWLASLPDQNPLADPNGDGIPQLLAFATGARAASPAHEFLPSVTVQSLDVGGVVGQYAVIAVRELIGATGVATRIENSSTLQNWTPAAGVLVSVTDHGDGTMTRSFRLPLQSGHTFLRLAVSQTP